MAAPAADTIIIGAANVGLLETDGPTSAEEHSTSRSSVPLD